MSATLKRLLYITNVLAKRRQKRPTTETPISVAVRNAAFLIPKGRTVFVHPGDPKRLERLGTEIRSGFKNDQRELSTQNITLLDTNGRPLVTVQDLDAYLNPVTNPVPVIAYALDSSGPPMPIAALAPYTPPKLEEPVRPKAQLTDQQLLEAVREEVSGTARLNLADDAVTMQRKLTPLLMQHPVVKENASRIAHDLAHAVIAQSRQAAIHEKKETQAIASFLRTAPVWKTLADNKPIAHIFQPPQVSYNKYSTIQTVSIKTPICDAKAMSSLLRTDPIKNAGSDYVHIGAQAYGSDNDDYAPFQDIGDHRPGHKCHVPPHLWCPRHRTFHRHHKKNGVLSETVEGTAHATKHTLEGAGHVTSATLSGAAHAAGELTHAAVAVPGKVLSAFTESRIAASVNQTKSTSNIACNACAPGRPCTKHLGCAMCLPNDPCVLHRPTQMGIRTQMQDLDAFIDDSDGAYAPFQSEIGGSAPFESEIGGSAPFESDIGDSAPLQSGIGCIYCTQHSPCDEHQGHMIGCHLCKLLGICHKHKKEAQHMQSLISNIGGGLHLFGHRHDDMAHLHLVNWMLEPVTLYVDGNPVKTVSFLHTEKYPMSPGEHDVAILRGAHSIMSAKKKKFLGGHCYLFVASLFTNPHQDFLKIHSSLPQAQASTAFVRAAIHDPHMRVSFLDAGNRMTPLSEAYTPVPAGTSAFYVQGSAAGTPAPIDLTETLGENGLYDYHIGRHPETKDVLSLITKTHTLPEASSFAFGHI